MKQKSGMDLTRLNLGVFYTRSFLEFLGEMPFYWFTYSTSAIQHLVVTECGFCFSDSYLFRAFPVSKGDRHFWLMDFFRVPNLKSCIKSLSLKCLLFLLPWSHICALLFSLLFSLLKVHKITKSNSCTVS